jgi:ketosteroid isomerase-like protein
MQRFGQSRDTARAVSQENVEIVRRLYETVNDAGLEAVIEFFHPDAQVVPPPQWPEASILRGREAVQEFARQWMTAFDDFEVEPERFIDSGGDQVVAYVHDMGRIAGSDAEIDLRPFHVWTLTAGKIVRWQLFTDEAEALEAAGL